MTKIHETFYRGQVGTIKDKILETDHGLKGEFVIVLDHSSQSQSSSFEGDELRVMEILTTCLLYTSPSPRDATLSRMPSSA